MADRIKAYFMRVSEDGAVYKGYLGEIEDTLEAKQRYVNFGRAGGLIQAVRLTEEIDVVCDDESKMKQFPPNRAWFYKGELADIFCGNILCVRHNNEGEFISIKEEDIPVIEAHLKAVTQGIFGLSPISSDRLPEWSGDEGY